MGAGWDTTLMINNAKCFWANVVARLWLEVRQFGLIRQLINLILLSKQVSKWLKRRVKMHILGGLNASGRIFSSYVFIFPTLETDLTTFYVCYVARHVPKIFVTFYWPALQ